MIGINDISKHRKLIIGGVHLLALPGTVGYDEIGGMNKIIDTAIEDSIKMQEGGVHGILFANESDMPYLQELEPETIAGYTRAVAEIVKHINIPFGINVLMDPVAAIAIANATGGQFVRGFFTGTYVGDMPLMNSRGGEAIKLRHNLRAERIKIIANATCGIGMSLDTRDVGTRVRGAIMHSKVDMISVSGAAAGFEAKLNEIDEAVKASSGIPVIVGTGANKDNIKEYIKIADGAIVATSLREGCKTLGRVDLLKVKEFMQVVNACE